MIHREKDKKSHVFMKNLLECYAVIVPVTFVIVFAHVNIFLKYTFPPSEVLGDWYCFAYELFSHAAGMYLGVFSLFTAGMKYLFIVKHAQVKRFGEEKASTIFLTSYLVIPIIISVLNAASNGNVDLLFWVNNCWGHQPKTESEEYDMFCYHRQYQTAKYFGENASYYLDPILRTTCGSLGIFYVIFFSNMTELILYFMLFKYLNR